MIVCSCHVVTDREIVETAKLLEASTVEELQVGLSVCETCHACYDAVQELINAGRVRSPHRSHKPGATQVQILAPATI